MKLGSYAKSIVAAVTAGGAALGTALADDTVTTGEWVGVALAVLGALGITYVVPNAKTSDPR
jgi:threonine/homoserine efflux transporter RhtA